MGRWVSKWPAREEVCQASHTGGPYCEAAGSAEPNLVRVRVRVRVGVRVK